LINEDQLEQLCLDSLTSFVSRAGNYVYGPDIAPDSGNPERSDYRQVVLQGRLLNTLQVFNPAVPLNKLEEVAASIGIPEYPILTKSNKAFHHLLLDGVAVSWSEGNKEKHDRVRLIDFNTIANNQFLVVNQFTVQGTKMSRRPDIVVFINGLPIAVIELKNPADENADIWNAYNQLQTYKNEISDLFVFNAALVISDGVTARIGSLTANKEWFMPWRTIKDENDKPLLEYELEKVVRGFFDRELLLDYIRHFILFEQNGDSITKKIAGYHQFHAVREAVRVTLIASRKDEVKDPRATYGKEVIPGSRKAGVVWHTQGSGKSISMVCYAGKALVVGMSRDICVSLFNEIIALRPQWAGTRLEGSSAYNPEDGVIRIVMTGSASDRSELQSHIYSKAQKKRLERRFKDPDDSLKLVIVRDMWLTGFDAPCMHTMYIDKPMRGANLMQAIARVNRVFKDKVGGLVVDYIGIANELKNALKTYTDAKGRGRPTNFSAEALAVLMEKLDVVRGMNQRCVN